MYTVVMHEYRAWVKSALRIVRETDGGGRMRRHRRRRRSESGMADMWNGAERNIYVWGGWGCTDGEQMHKKHEERAARASMYMRA